MECSVCGQTNAENTSACLSCGHPLPSYIGGVSVDTSYTKDENRMVITGNIDIPLPPPAAKPVSPQPAPPQMPKLPPLPKIRTETAAAPEPKRAPPSQTAPDDEEEDTSPPSPSSFVPSLPSLSDPLPIVAPMGRPEHMIYAGFWYRFLAWLIDLVVLGVAQGALIVIVLMVSPTSVSIGSGLSLSSLWLFIGAYGVVILACLVLSLLYFSLSESSRWQGTVGKLAIGLKVTSTRGNRLSFLHALARYVMHFITNLTFGLGYVLNVFTSRQQALHDLMVKTLVVYKEVTPLDLADHPAVPARTAQRATVLLVWVMSAVFLVIATMAAQTFVEISKQKSAGIAFRMYEAESLGAEATAAVTEYHEIYHHFPPTLEAADFHQVSPQVRRLWIDADSNIVYVELDFPPLKRKTLFFVPETDREGDLIWRCRSDDIDPQYLPEHCR